MNGRRGRAGRALLAAWYWAVVAFLFAPLAVVVVFSFSVSQFVTLPIRGWTLSWYAKLLANGQIHDSLVNSLVAGFASTALSVLLGVPLAIGIQRHLRPRLRQPVYGFATLPMMTPRLVLGIMLLSFFNAAGVELSLLTVIAGHTVIGLPYVVLIARARLMALDPRLEEAAWDLGADRATALRTVTLPLLKPAVLGAALIAFTLSFDDVVVAFFTTGVENTLPMHIWSMMRFGITPEVNALASVTILVSGLTALAAEIALRRAAAPGST